eukprot:CAMPEP_0118859466 /NCGR_PEP_ID=MMETSP1163-20130328/5700_1 /TAXON_ID=124430 /ORGANISM="Phaeomonas parva, Strain CCMP2877" /LENGTH=351 /DNA_ID=CAMNT_0006793057 /DNA_START=339 /DNA_END=1393 /DNA_ORIENTATION=+
MNYLRALAVIAPEPSDDLPDALVHGLELVVRQVRAQLGVGRRLLELAVRLARVELHLVVAQAHLLRDHLRNVRDAHLVLLAHREDDGVHLVVVAHRPHRQRAEILGVDELPQRRARAPDDEVAVPLLGQISLVHEARDDVALLDAEVVIGPVDVRGHDARELAAVLVLVAAVHDVDEALGVGVALVALVRRAVVDHGLIDGVGRLVREDARAQAGHELLDAELAAALHDVVIDEDVFPEEVDLAALVREEAAHERREVDDVRRPVASEDGPRRLLVPQVAVAARQEDVGLVRRERVLLDGRLDALPHQARAARHEDALRADRLELALIAEGLAHRAPPWLNPCITSSSAEP